MLHVWQVGSEAEAHDTGTVEVPANVKDGALFLDDLLLNLRKVSCSLLACVCYIGQDYALTIQASAPALCGCTLWPCQPPLACPSL